MYTLYAYIMIDYLWITLNRKLRLEDYIRINTSGTHVEFIKDQIRFSLLT